MDMSLFCPEALRFAIQEASPVISEENEFERFSSTAYHKHPPANPRPPIAFAVANITVSVFHGFTYSREQRESVHGQNKNRQTGKNKSEGIPSLPSSFPAGIEQRFLLLLFECLPY